MPNFFLSKTDHIFEDILFLFLQSKNISGAMDHRALPLTSPLNTYNQELLYIFKIENS